MPDPFSFFADPSQAALGVAPPAPTATPKPAAPAPVAPPRGAAASMLAPAAPDPQPSVPAPAAQPQHPATGGNVDQFMQLVRAHESGGNDKASSGVANGRYQFTPATWAGVARQHPELGLQPNDIWDGNKQDLAMRAITKDYENVLAMNKIPASMPNMFMLHFLGTGGGPKFLKAMQADPNASAPAMFPLEAQYNPTIFHDKAGQPRTLQQVYALMTKSFSGPAASMAPINPTELKAQGEFEKAAGVPTQVRNFTEGRAAAEDLPPILPGMKLDKQPAPLPGMSLDVKPLPPLLPGLKLDLSADKPLTQGNPYAEPPKPTPPPGTGLKEIEGYDPAPPGAIGQVIGEPRFSDPKAQAEYNKARRADDMGVLAGMAQDVTGLLSLLPNQLGGGAVERANETLAKTGNAGARAVGNIAPMALPVGEVAGAVKLGTKALEAGESLVPSMLKGAGWGFAGGAASESSNPTGKEDYGERLRAKTPGMVEGGLIGAGLGGLVPGGVAGAKWLYNEAGHLKQFIADAFGKEALKSAEELRSGISAKTGQAMTAEEQKIAQAKVEEGAARAKQAAAEAELKHLDTQQEKLRNRMQDRVKAAEKVAEKAGLDARAAREFAQHQETAVAKAEESADKLAKDFAARPTMTKEEFGAQLQETAAKDAEALKKERAEKSGFDAAVKSDGGKPSIPTKRFISALAEAETRAVSPAAKAAIASTKEELKTAVEGGKVSAVSIERARRIVQNIDSRIEGINSDEAHEITALKKQFVEHMETTHPQLKTAREKYAELSRPLDVYRDTGALAKSVLEDPYSGRAIQDTTKTVGALLNKTEDGADALGRLVKANPALQDSARKFFNQRLVDVANGKATPSESQFSAFLRDNRLALDRAGLTNEFKDLAAAKATQERIAKQVVAGADDAKRAAGAAEKVADAAEKDVNAAKTLKDRAAQPGTLKAQRADPKARSEEAAGEMADAARKQESARAFQTELTEMTNKLDPEISRTGPEVVSEAYKIADWMLEKERIDGVAHKALLAEIRDVEQKNLDHTAAARRVRQILVAAGVAALGGAGVEAGHYISHRVHP